MADRNLHKVDLEDHGDIVDHRNDIMMDRKGRIPHGHSPFDALEKWESNRTIVGKRNPDGSITLGVCNGFYHEPGDDATMRVAWLNPNETIDRATDRATVEASWETTIGALALEGLFDQGPCVLPRYHKGSCEPGGGSP